MIQLEKEKSVGRVFVEGSGEKIFEISIRFEFSMFECREYWYRWVLIRHLLFVE